MRAGYYGVVCGSLVLTVLAGGWVHLQHTPLWHSERAVIMSHSILGIPPHVERPFLRVCQPSSGKLAGRLRELWGLFMSQVNALAGDGLPLWHCPCP
jgi:hypothetical protein